MSLNLDYSEGGVWIKTYSGMADTKEGPFHTFLLGHKETGTRQRPLHEATKEIYELTHTRDASDDPMMRNLCAFLGNLDILPHPDYTYRDGEPREVVTPSHRSETALQKARAAADRGEAPVMFMGVDIDRKDFVELVNYVMTNTLLHPEDWKGEGEDPRKSMLEEARVTT